MKTISKLATAAALAVAALALAGNAFATQRLSVTQSSTSLTIKVTQDQTDQQPAKIQIFVPTGYTANTGQTAGTVIGSTSGTVFARDQNLMLPLEGNVIVDNPASHTKDVCSPGNNLAVWLLNLSVAGQTISLPVYVNPTTGAQSALGSLVLTVCLGPADTPQGSPGRSPFGSQLVSATFTVNNVFTIPSTGISRWASLWTPYATGTGLPNVAGTVEARAFVGTGTASIAGRITSKKRRIVRISGRVAFAGTGVAGASVRLSINGKLRYSTKTRGTAGAYAFVLKKTTRKKTTTFFQVRAHADEQDVTTTGCTSPSVPPIPCVSATQSAFDAFSRKIRIRI